MAENALTVTITADTKDATSNVSDLEARLAALEKTYGTVSTATNTATAATSKSSIETRVAAEAAEGLGGALDSLATHYKMVSSGAEIFGLETTAAAGKVVALTEVIEGLEAACLPLLVALVAFEAAAKVFEFFKDAAEQATVMQAQLETLGAAVDNQGAKWEEMSGAVGQWIAQEAMASGFLRSELVPALNELVTAGNSVADSEKILAVAEEVAIAKHRDVKDIVELLIAAEAGRGQGLVKLDGNLKSVVATHGHMSDGLKILHNDFKNQIEDGDSAERTFNRLKVELEGVSLVVGEKLLPFLVDMGYTLIGAIKNAELFGNVFTTAFEGINLEIVAAGKAMGEFGKAIDLVMHGNFAGAAQMFQSGINVYSAASKTSDTKFANAVGAWYNAPDATTQGRHIAGSAVKSHEDHVSNLNLSKDGVFGNEKKSGGGSTVSFADALAPAPTYDAIAEAQKNLIAQTDALDQHNKELKAGIDNATTAAQKQALQTAYDATVSSDLTAKKKLLSDAMMQEVVVNQQLEAQLKTATSAADAARTAYNKFGDSAANDGSVEAQNHLAILKTTMDNTAATVTDLGKRIKENTDNFTANDKAVQSNTIAIIQNGNASAAAARQKQEALDKINTAWTAFYSKSEQDMLNDLRTEQMTNAQKFAYYKNLVDSTAVVDENSLKLREDYRRDELQSYKAMLEEQAKDYKKWVDDSTKQTASFIDGIVVEHKSLKDELKSVYDQILKSYIDMIAKMIVQSALFKDIFPYGGAGGTSGGSTGMFGTLTGALGGKSATAPTGAAGSPFYVVTTDADGNFLSKTTGSSTGVSAASIMANMNSGTSDNSTSDNPDDFVAAAQKAMAGQSSSSASKLMTGAMAGMAIGSTAASLVNPDGNQSNASSFAAVAGVVGAHLMVVNPLLGAAVVAGAGILGSFIGPHETAAETPDISDPGYVHNQANWMGGSSADQAYNPNAGGLSEGAQMQQWAASVKGSQDTLTQQQKDLFNQITGLQNGSTDSDAISDVTSLHQGVWTLKSGAQISYQDAMALQQSFQQDVGGGAGGPIPTFNISRPYGNANTSSMAQTGSVPADGVNVTPTVNITINGSVVGSDGMNELTTIVSQGMYGQQRGTQPFAGGGGVFNQNGGGF